MHIYLFHNLFGSQHSWFLDKEMWETWLQNLIYFIVHGVLLIEQSSPRMTQGLSLNFSFIHFSGTDG